MKVIKGLIVKDLLQLKIYRKTLLLFLLVFIAISLMQTTNNSFAYMIIPMITLGFSMFSIASFSYDEMFKVDKFILNLPVNKKEIVISKYIFVIIATILGALVGVIFSIVLDFVILHRFNNIMETITTGLASIFSLSLIVCIQIPCIYKWGAEKGRICFFIIVGILIGLILILFNVVEKLGINISLEMIVSNISIIFIALTIISYVISYFVSRKVYINKEF